MKMMVDSVHGSWTAGGSVHHGPLGGANRRPPERGGMLAEDWSRTAPELGSSPASVGCGEGRTVKPVWRTLGLVRRRGGQAATASQRWERSSEVAMFDLGEEGWRRWDECGESQVRASAFYIGRREAGAPAASIAGHEGAGYPQ
jgi:hypothetical protein